MTQDTDRIPVPTNGRGPRKAEPAPPPGEDPPLTDDERAASREATIAFTPNQLAVGFGIVAGLLLLFAGARRRRGRSGRDA